MRRILLVAIAAWLATATSPASAEGALPTLRSTRPVVSIRQGSALSTDSWRLAPEVKPDVFDAEILDGKPTTVTFLSDVDSIRFEVAEGSTHDFVIEHGADRCFTRIVGVRVVPMAVFDEAYRAKHRGTITAEIPEAYELVNIVLAMTPTGIADSNLVYQQSSYYRDVRAWFDPYRGHAAVAALDSMLVLNRNHYFSLKMNGYSFELDAKGRLVPSKIYDRTGFGGERRNTLRPFLSQLQSFADTTRFRSFYERNRPVYEAQVAFYRDSADVKAMLAWLNRNFPKSGGYDSNRIIFSPLVAYNQSATWLESHGFQELQAHVNFPYPGDWKRRAGIVLSKEAETVTRGHIVFTELNHGYINPEADKHAPRVMKAISNRDRWVDPARGQGYYGGIAAFNEYMNWGLAGLRVVDIAPLEDQPTLLTLIDDMMTKRRGFPMYAEFSRFLVDRYRGRKKGESLADLYPDIIAWFEARNVGAVSR